MNKSPPTVLSVAKAVRSVSFALLWILSPPPIVFRPLKPFRLIIAPFELIDTAPPTY